MEENACVAHIYSFLPSQMEGRASPVSLGDFKPELGSLLESCMLCFWLISGETDITSAF